MLPTNIDQVVKGLSRNIDHLDKENFNKLLSLFLEQIQKLQEDTIEIADQKNIDTAQGVWLDWIGKILGEGRGGKNDLQYRSALKLKIGVNSADGTPNNIIDLTKQLTDAIDSKLIEYPIASFFSVITTDSLLDGSAWQLVDDIKPAGVSATVIHNLDGNRVIPAWNRQDIILPMEEPFLLDNGDFLLLDDGLDEDNYLIINYLLPNIYNSTDSYFLFWEGDTPENNAGKGLLAQKIYNYTTN